MEWPSDAQFNIEWNDIINDVKISKKYVANIMRSGGDTRTIQSLNKMNKIYLCAILKTFKADMQNVDNIIGYFTKEEHEILNKYLKIFKLIEKVEHGELIGGVDSIKRMREDIVEEGNKRMKISTQSSGTEAAKYKTGTVQNANTEPAANSKVVKVQTATENVKSPTGIQGSNKTEKKEVLEDKKAVAVDKEETNYSSADRISDDTKLKTLVSVDAAIEDHKTKTALTVDPNDKKSTEKGVTNDTNTKVDEQHTNTETHNIVKSTPQQEKNHDTSVNAEIIELIDEQDEQDEPINPIPQEPSKEKENPIKEADAKSKLVSADSPKTTATREHSPNVSRRSKTRSPSEREHGEPKDIRSLAGYALAHIINESIREENADDIQFLLNIMKFTDDKDITNDAVETRKRLKKIIATGYRLKMPESCVPNVSAVEELVDREEKYTSKVVAAVSNEDIEELQTVENELKEYSNALAVLTLKIQELFEICMSQKELLLNKNNQEDVANH